MNIHTEDQFEALLAPLRESQAPNQATFLTVLHAWSAKLVKGACAQIPGAVFLSLWTRRNTLSALLDRELGPSQRQWVDEQGVLVRRYPLGLVGHWPAANVEINLWLSLLCSLCAGNSVIVRVPSTLQEVTKVFLESLEQIDNSQQILKRVTFVSFPRERRDLHEAMARKVDGAVLWGGEEAILANRSLPFPSQARLIAFGPRISAVALDRKSWTEPATFAKTAERIAREVWQFEQQACSSPQYLFLESDEGDDFATFLQTLEAAFARENDLHPREKLDPRGASAVLKARAENSMAHPENIGKFPFRPDWSLLLHRGPELPNPTQFKVLHILPLASLDKLPEKISPDFQTVGLELSDKVREMELAESLAQRGVDRIVRLGCMHLFESPWDGIALLSSQTRLVRYLPSR